MALDEALKTLEPEDRLIVQMRFGDGYSVADVARVLQVPPKTLYRRVEGLRLRLREYLENSGIQDFVHPGILGPDGLPIREEVLQESRIITDISSANSRIISLVERDPATMYDLSPRQFEELVAELLSKKGYTIELTPASKDGGFDMYAARKDGIGEFLYLVECKRYAQFRPVGVDVVRSLYGVVQKERATAGIIVTTSRFTRGAAEFQTTVPHQLSLRDYLHLQEWLAPTFF
jgi:restriction system protein